MPWKEAWGGSRDGALNEDMHMTRNLIWSSLVIIGALCAGCGNDVCQQAVTKYNDCLASCTTCTNKQPISFSGECSDKAQTSSGGTIPMLSRSRLYNECAVGRTTCTCTIPVGYPFD
jgi:hypothetical protein